MASRDSKIVNLSARALVGSRGQFMIGGFGVSGSGEKRVLIRALGPHLAAFGVDETLAASAIDVYDSAGVLIASNEHWQPELASAFEAAGATPLPSG